MPEMRQSTIALSALIAISLLSAFSRKSSDGAQYSSNYLREANRSFLQLEEAAESFRTNNIRIDSLRSVFLKARESYKKVEFILAFSYPEYISETINGAPLLHLEKENSSPLVANPVGLQVLDELIFSDEAENEKNEIANLARRLKNNYSVLYQKIGSLPFDTHNGIAAMRLQLVRIFSLGVTGFDTPGSLNAIPEAVASFEGMHHFLAENYPKMQKDKKKRIEELMEGSIGYLKSAASFDDLDRLVLLKEYIDPLYRELGSIQKKADTEFLSNITSWNPKSTSIFAEDFLNPYFFTELGQREDSESLRALGRDLFYDPLVSGAGEMSCASCHQPEKAFTDAAAKSASSIQGKTVMRNAPTLLNAVYADRYFYDLRAFSLEQQAEHVIFNSDEFNTAYSAILKKLNSRPEYRKKFKKVFGKGEASRENFSKALVSYVLSLKSFDSPFDKYARGESMQISQDAKNGFNLFMGKANCATCHFAPTFSGLVPPLYNESESEILGVLQTPDAQKLDEDEGRHLNKIASEKAWIYERSFKTTTIRNVELTAPYFHNGAYKTLEEVVEFYEKGGGAGIGLEVSNQTLSPEKLNLTEKEKKELVAFMKSLTGSQHKF
ncbi:MAG TPA: cytochrome c peroxidase [Flavobacterium sp.]|nr:cytochrome c peroxidase [Flavobacterium sp.]